MKRIAIIPTTDIYVDNKLFEIDDGNLNHDNNLLPYYKLRESLAASGYQLDTIDCIENYDEVETFIFMNFHKKYYELLKRKNLINRCIYLAMEPPSVDLRHTLVGLRMLSKLFPSVLTWRSDAQKNCGYFLLPYDFEKKYSPNMDDSQKKLLVNISNNKYSFHKNELYSERVKLIEAFKDKSNFDLYGTGWEKYSGNCWKGRCKSKLETLTHYRFSICFENMHGICGYITEKILDCLCAGVVPIYYGASDIRDYVPQECFIDYSTFKSPEELYEYLNKMPDDDYQVYKNAIDRFCCSEAALKFSGQELGNTLLRVTNSIKINTFHSSALMGYVVEAIGLVNRFAFKLGKMRNNWLIKRKQRG